MTRGLKYHLIALALSVGLGNPASGQEKIEISFAITHVEDKYAINLPIFRDMFRLLDFGYAGCSVELEVISNGAEIPPGANPKIQIDYTVQLAPGKPPYTNQSNGSIARHSVPIYLNNKCAEIFNLKIAGAVCFAGFKGQWSKLSCPYQFRINEFSIPEYYDRRQ
jgi:hypothetical protein